MYCGIIGFPLKKPRSIKIWKKFFLKKKINCKMIPIEIKPKELSKKMNSLKYDLNFKAAAITMPYKEKVYKLTIPKDRFSLKARSVNLIVKNKFDFFGYNTDVYGAFKEIKNIKKKTKVLIYGYGGTGKAIFLNLINAYKKSKFIIISKKNIKFKNKNIILRKKIFNNDLIDVNLFINCSPLGSNLRKQFLNKSPLTDFNYKFLNKNCEIFDIVYSPQKTKLFYQSKKNKIKYYNGLTMNSLQAKKSLEILSRFF
tara:strand:- start:904 stop:1668 length:765 start_codon:yes stop_codon:yes gene_type:complete